VGINVALRSEVGETLRECFDTRGLLTRLALAHCHSNTACVRFIDPFGNTTFNCAQAKVLVAELEALRASTDEPTRLLIDEVLVLGKEVASGLHLYLVFIGD
jgi:hypothetical protein